MIGAHAKKVFAVKFQHLGNFIEHLGDLVILYHRHLTRLCCVTCNPAHRFEIDFSSALFQRKP
jgi:hypothetical protein